MDLIQRTLENLWKRRDKSLNGGVNCIPSPLKRFSSQFVGTEQGKYYVVTGNTKAGKTQLANYIFIYNNILYAYYHPDKVRLHIHYFPLEETPEVVLERFMCYLLYILTQGATKISPTDLKSTGESKVVDEKILKLLETSEYQNILKFFIKVITFSNSKNPTGINKECIAYAKANGKIHTKKMVFIDKDTKQESVSEVFDYYEQNDPDEYRIIFIDHISLITTEQGMDLRNSINKLSGEYLVKLRNDYKYSIVVVQQQTSDTESLDNFKQGKLKPSMSGLADSKYTGRDANIVLGIFYPFRHELKEYLKYDITKLKAYGRFVEILVNRDGESNGVCPIYFDGCCNYITELPRYDDKLGLNKVYNLINSSQNEALFFMKVINKINNKCCKDNN